MAKLKYGFREPRGPMESGVMVNIWSFSTQDEVSMDELIKHMGDAGQGFCSSSCPHCSGRCVIVRGTVRGQKPKEGTTAE